MKLHAHKIDNYQFTPAGRPTYAYRDLMIETNHNPQADSLGTRLQYWMKLTGTSQSELAKRCAAVGAPYGIKMSQSDIHSYRYGVCCPKSEKLVVLAKTMNVSKQWLQGYGQREMRFRHDAGDAPVMAPTGPRPTAPRDTVGAKLHMPGKAAHPATTPVM